MAKLIEESHTLKKLSLSGDLALGEAGVNSIGIILYSAFPPPSPLTSFFLTNSLFFYLFLFHALTWT